MSVTCIKDLPAIELRSLSPMLGGWKRLRKAEQISIETDGGTNVVKIVQVPGNIGGGTYPLFSCPECGGGCRLLRLYKQRLRCTRCLQRIGRRYRSQDYTAPLKGDDECQA